MCGYVEDGGVTILRIRQLLNYPHPAVSAHRSLENLATILKFFSFKRLPIVSCHFLYPYLNVEKYDTMIFWGSPTEFSAALFCHVGEA